MSRGSIPPLGRNPFLGKQREPLNRAISSANDLSLITGDSPFQRGPIGSFIEGPAPYAAPLDFYGVVVNSGPYGESDYTDARYWVQAIDWAQAAYADVNAIVSPYVLTLPYWVSATNLAEVVAGTHSLTTVAALDPSTPTTASVVNAGGTLVRVRELAAGKLTSDKTDYANKVYICEPIAGGATVFVTGKVTGNAAGNGKYTGKSFANVTADVSASGNLAESDFGTLASADDCLLLNTKELGVSNTGHDVTAATNTAQFSLYFMGRLARVNSTGTKVVHVSEFWVGC